MAKVYRVKDWEKHYENNRTTDMKIMRWVPFPNRHDGDGYCQMVDGPTGAAMLGAWVACVQVARRCDPRGTLLRSSHTPHTASSLARITRLSEMAIQNMLDRACQPSIQWMQVEEIQEVITLPAELPQEPAEKPQEPARKEGRNGREWKGMEGTVLPPQPAAKEPENPDVEEDLQMPPTSDDPSPPPTPTKPPKFPSTPRRPDPIWDTVVELFFGGISAKPDLTHIGKIVAALKEHGATPEEIRRRRDLYLFRWPNVSCTADAMVKHWSNLGAPDPPRVLRNAFTGQIFQESKK